MISFVITCRSPAARRRCEEEDEDKDREVSESDGTSSKMVIINRKDIDMTDINSNIEVPDRSYAVYNIRSDEYRCLGRSSFMSTSSSYMTNKQSSFVVPNRTDREVSEITAEPLQPPPRTYLIFIRR